MIGDINGLLAQLREAPVPALPGFEAALWQEIRHRRARSQIIMGAIGRNTGIAAAGLAIGIILAITRPVASHRPVNIPLLLTEVPPASLLE